MALETWNIDTSHSSIGFAVRHLVVSKVRGHFTKWTGDVKLDPQNLAASSVSVEIDATSISTNNEQRDGHLKSGDFLGSEEAPRLTFKSRRVEPGSGDHFKIVGDLTIRGVTKEVTLDAEKTGQGKDPWGGERAGFSAKTSINRSDYGVKWNQALEAGGVVVAEKVEIEMEIEAVKAKA